MKAAIEIISADFNDSMLPSQYDDLVRRRSLLDNGEYRLLWAVLEEAIRTYRANRKGSNPIQRKRFEEVRSWFEPSEAQPRAGLSFRRSVTFSKSTVCSCLNG
jgi:hypothetical protein